jgi:hypothetical protein
MSKTFKDSKDAKHLAIVKKSKRGKKITPYKRNKKDENGRENDPW